MPNGGKQDHRLCPNHKWAFLQSKGNWTKCLVVNNSVGEFGAVGDEEADP